MNACELEKVIKSLPNKTSSGWDGLNNKLIKSLCDVILVPLMQIINCSFHTGVFTDLMKMALVNPLYKSGSMVLCTNYSPISLLPVLSKIVEKAMHSRLYDFLQDTNQIYQSQYSFRKRHSCEHAIQELLSSTLKSKENNEYTATIYLDLSKAFDTLEHTILFKKLEIYGVRGVGLDWLKSYLENRTMSIRCLAGDQLSRDFSDSQIIDYSVPQGSCLGPLLFLIYNNDLSLNLENSNSILFCK